MENSGNDSYGGMKNSVMDNTTRSGFFTTSCFDESYSVARGSRIEKLPNKKLQGDLTKNPKFVIVFQTIEIERLSYEIETLRVHLKNSERQIRNLLSHEIQVRQLTEKCLIMEQEKEDLQNQIEKENIICRNLYLEIDDLTDRYADMEEELAKKNKLHSQEISHLRKQLQTMEESLMEQQKHSLVKFSQLQRMLLQSDQEKQAIQETYQARIHQSLEEHTKERRKFEESVESLTKSYKEISTQFQLLKIKKRDLEIQMKEELTYERGLRHKEKEANDREILGLNDKVALLTNEIMRLNESLYSQEEVISVAQKGYESTLQSLNKEKDAHKATQEHLELKQRQMKTRLQEQLESAIHLKTQLEHKSSLQQQDLRDKEKDIRGQRDTISSMKEYEHKISRHVEQLEQNLGDLQQKFLHETEKMKTTISSNEKNIAEQNQMNQNNQKQIAEQNQVNYQLEKEIAKCKMQGEQVNEDIDRIYITLNEKIAKINQCKDYIKEQDKLIKINTQKHQELDTQMKSYHQELQDLGTRNKDLHNLNDDLEEQILKFKSQISDNELRIENLSEDLEVWTKLAEARQGTIETLTVELDASKQSIREKSSEIEANKVEISNLEREVFECNQQMMKYQNQLDEARQQRQSLESQIQSLNTTISSLQQQTVTLNTTITQKSALIEQLSSQLQQQRDLYDGLSNQYDRIMEQGHFTSEFIDNYQQLDKDNAKKIAHLDKILHNMAGTHNIIGELRMRIEKYQQITDDHNKRIQTITSEFQCNKTLLERVSILTEENFTLKDQNLEFQGKIRMLNFQMVEKGKMENINNQRRRSSIVKAIDVLSALKSVDQEEKENRRDFRMEKGLQFNKADKVQKAERTDRSNRPPRDFRSSEQKTIQSINFRGSKISATSNTNRMMITK